MKGRDQLKALLADGYARVFARPMLAPFNKALVYLGSRGLGVYNLSSSELSGEEAFLRSLAADPPSVAIDVGANQGDYVEALLHHFPNTRIIAFEPHPATFQRLAARHGKRAECVNRAVDATPGRKELFDLADAGGSQLASLNRGAVGVAGRSITSVEVEAVTLDDFCRDHSIGEIGLLKIDTEGNERRVLEGSRRMIAENRIRWIQFEFNEMNVAARSFLRDFIELLPRHDLERLLPSGRLDLGAASIFYREIFGFQNIVARPTRVPRREDLAGST